MDRSILEADPHSLVEGLTIAAYAIGASTGYIYVRAEYPLAVKRLRIALEQADARGFLGNNIFDSGFDFQVHVMEGAAM
jgi:NADH:ubiquinone oxidoreductase subunit F (NADH-binding)